MINIRAALMILAVVCFLLSALNVTYPRCNFTAAGLFFWAFAVLIG